MGKDRTVAFKIPAEKLRALAKQADATGQTVAGYVRMLVYESLNDKKHGG